MEERRDGVKEEMREGGKEGERREPACHSLSFNYI